MSDAERIARIKELNKARARKYYEANKEAIAERRKAKRAECRQALGKAPRSAEKAPAPEPAPVAEPAPAPVPAPRPRIKRPKTVKQAQREAEEKAKTLAYENAVKIIASSDFPSEDSRKMYLHHLKTVKDILACDNLITCFQNAPEVIKALNDAKQKRDPTKGYSINSKKSYVQMILKLSDVLGIPLSAETKQDYVDAFDVLKLDSKEQTKARQEEAKESKEEPLTFQKYLPMVAEKYGTDSKEYLIASLYSINGFRDDLQLRLVRVPDDKGDNQLVVARPGHPYRILLNKYKTDAKYGIKTVTVPSEISKLIRSYITKNKLKIDSFLLGPNKLTGFISKFNREMGLPVSINTYREMLVSPVIGTMSSVERVQLAKKMGHSPATSEHYRAKKK